MSGMRIPAIVFVVMLSPAAHAWTQSVTPEGDGRVSVQARSVRLGKLLRELEAVSSMGRLLIDPDVEARTVSVSLENVEISDALREIFGAAGIDFVIWGGKDQMLGVFAGDVEDALLVQREGESFDSGEGSSRDEPDPEIEIIAESVESEPSDEDGDRAFQSLQEALSPQPRQDSGMVTLPFVHSDGTPISVPVDPANKTNALPFPGPDGLPIVVDPPQAATPTELPEDPAERQLIQALTSAKKKPQP